MAHRAREQALLIGGLDRIGIERLRSAHLRRGGTDRLGEGRVGQGRITGHDSPWTKRDCRRAKAFERTPPAAASTSTMPCTRSGLRAAKASAMVPPVGVPTSTALRIPEMVEELLDRQSWRSIGW